MIVKLCDVLNMLFEEGETSVWLFKSERLLDVLR